MTVTAEELKMSTGLLVYVLVIAWILGTVMASFITCLVDRKENQKSLWGHSQCDACGHTLGAKDLVPVVSYLALKGRCRYCGAKIGKRCLWTEIGLGAVFCLTVLRYGISFEAVQTMAVSTVCLGISLYDLDTLEIPDGFQIALLVIWALGIPWVNGKDSLLGCLVLGGGMLVLSLLMDKILKKESMGGGDIKMLGIMGLYLGLMNGLFTLILSCIIGLIFAGVGKKKKIPFGPSLSAAFVIGMLYGNLFVSWYLGFMGL